MHLCAVARLFRDLRQMRVVTLLQKTFSRWWVSLKVYPNESSSKTWTHTWKRRKSLILDADYQHLWVVNCLSPQKYVSFLSKNVWNRSPSCLGLYPPCSTYPEVVWSNKAGFYGNVGDDQRWCYLLGPSIRETEPWHPKPVPPIIRAVVRQCLGSKKGPQELG